MLRKNEPKSARIEYGPVLILGVLFIASILMTICVLSVMLLNRQKEPRPVPQQDIPAIFTPTAVMPPASLPTAMPASHFLIHLPTILSGSVSVSDLSESVTVPDLSESASEQIWEVTEINNLGYELDGQYYDLATFTRIDGQDTVKAYCINRGWDVPDIGTEYLLNAEGIFVPLHESDAHPIQRFLGIR